MRDEVALNGLGEDDEADFIESGRRLNHGVARFRRRAALELSSYGLRAVPILSRGLMDPDLSVREAVAEALGRTGSPEALAPLCGALQSRDLPTRAAAARALGELGDERAIPPLVEALSACFTHGSARFQRWLGFIVVLAATFLFCHFLFSEVSSSRKLAPLISYVVVVSWCIYAGGRRRHSGVCGAISEAIAKLAAVHPSPDLHQLALELRSVSVDFVLQERAVRRAASDAATRIESLTGRQRALPLAAAPPVVNHASLPLISGLPQWDDPSELDRT